MKSGTDPLRIGEVISRERLIRLLHRYAPASYLPQSRRVVEEWTGLADWSPAALAAAFAPPPEGHDAEALRRAAQAWATKIGETMGKTALHRYRRR